MKDLSTIFIKNVVTPSNIEDLLKKYKTVTGHHRDIQFLAIEKHNYDTKSCEFNDVLYFSFKIRLYDQPVWLSSLQLVENGFDGNLKF